MMTLTLTQWLLVAVLAGIVVLLVLAIIALVRNGGARVLRRGQEQLEAALREEQRAGRGEQAQAFEHFRGHMQQQLDAAATQQRERIEDFSKRLGQLTERTERGIEALRGGLKDDARKTREDGAQTLGRFGEQLRAGLGDAGERGDKRMAEMRATLEAQLKALQTDNAAQLEKMRATVDEKLQATLENRLTSSFKLISERLEAVQRGLGEMQSLATGVGDLKRVLTNVKTRGGFGEVRLGALLEQVLAPAQYAANVATVPGSGERVEFAIRLPGVSDDTPVWLPIDAKFPVEDYQRLQDARENADSDAAGVAAAALQRRVEDEAKTIHGKYIAPPHTTDFALLFLPTEGLYAEIIRVPGLFEKLQRDYHVTVAGPTTLAAILNALQMGFRTLAIEQRSSEVWRVLGAVKGEFGKFGGMLDSALRQVDTVRNTLKKATGKTTTIGRKLREVESLPGPAAGALLGLDDDDDDAGAVDDDDGTPTA